MGAALITVQKKSPADGGTLLLCYLEGSGSDFTFPFYFRYHFFCDIIRRRSIV
jgi:hypothetical protein